MSEERVTVVLRRIQKERGFGFAEVTDGPQKGIEAICGLNVDGILIQQGEPFECIIGKTPKGWRVTRLAGRSAPVLIGVSGVVAGRSLDKRGLPYWSVALSGTEAGSRVLIGSDVLFKAGLVDIRPQVEVVLDARVSGSAHWATELHSPSPSDAFGTEERVERPGWVVSDGNSKQPVTVGVWDRVAGIAVTASLWQSSIRAWGIRHLISASINYHDMTDQQLLSAVSQAEAQVKSSNGVQEVNVVQVALDRQHSNGRVRWFARLLLAPRSCRAPVEDEVVDWVAGVIEETQDGTRPDTKRPAGQVWFDDVRVGVGSASYYADQVPEGARPIKDGMQVCVTLRAGKQGWAVRGFNVIAPSAAPSA